MSETETAGLSAELARIKADTRSLAQTRTPSWGTVPKIQRVIDGTERLLAAIEKVLELSDKPSTGIPPVRIREAITREITGRPEPGAPRKADP